MVRRGIFVVIVWVTLLMRCGFMYAHRALPVMSIGQIEVDLNKVRKLVQHQPVWMRELIERFVSNCGSKSSLARSVLSPQSMQAVDTTNLVRFTIKGRRLYVKMPYKINDMWFCKSKVIPYCVILNGLITHGVITEDCDLFFCTSDYYCGNRDAVVLGICHDFCHSPQQKNVIPVPTFFYYEPLLNGSLKTVLNASMLDENAWTSKINKVFWRGQPSDLWNKSDMSYRTKLVIMGLHDHRLDVGFSGKLEYQSFQLFKQIFGADPVIASMIPPHDQLRYKYLLAVDGNSYATSLHWQLFSGSVVIKQETEFPQWFDYMLVPYKHYVPLKKDLSDLRAVLNWLESNDDSAKLIAERTQKFALEHLLPEHALAYFASLINEIGNRQKKPAAIEVQTVAI